MTAMTKEVLKGASSALQKAMRGSSGKDDDDDLPDLVVMAQRDAAKPTPKPTPKSTPKPTPKSTPKPTPVESGRGKPRSRADRLKEERERKDKEHMEALRKAYKPSDRSTRMDTRQEKEDETSQKQKELEEKRRLNELEKLRLQRELKKKRLQKHIETVTTRRKTDEEEREALRISAGNQLKEMRLRLTETKEETNQEAVGREERRNDEDNLRKIIAERGLDCI